MAIPKHIVINNMIQAFIFSFLNEIFSLQQPHVIKRLKNNNNNGLPYYLTLL